jgi:hypothetical protein
MPRVRGVERERGWAGELLTWQQAPLWQEAETGRAKYFVAAGPYEVQAWCVTGTVVGGSTSARSPAWRRRRLHASSMRRRG